MLKKITFLGVMLFSLLGLTTAFGKPKVDGIVLTPANPVVSIEIPATGETKPYWRVDSYDANLLSLENQVYVITSVHPRTGFIAGKWVYTFKATSHAFYTAPHNTQVVIVYDRESFPLKTHVYDISIQK